MQLHSSHSFQNAVCIDRSGDALYDIGIIVVIIVVIENVMDGI
jgi:hypothetical protein